MSDTLNMESLLNQWLIDGDGLSRAHLHLQRISVSALACGDKVLVIQNGQDIERHILPPAAAAALARALAPTECSGVSSCKLRSQASHRPGVT